jgi:ssDNA-binding replication factor A large subunit
LCNRRVVEAVEGGGEPSVGRSNRLPFSERRGEVGPLLLVERRRRVVSTDEQRNAEYQGGRGIVVQPTGLCEAVEGGGEPSVGRSNRLPFSERRGEVGPLLEGEPVERRRRVVSTDEQRNAEYQGGRGIVVQPTGLC